MSNRFVEKLRGYVQLSEDEERALERVTINTRYVVARKDLIREGDRPGPVFVMLQGWASRYKVLPNGSRQIMAFLMPGDACDLHIGLVHEMDHSIQTVTNAQVATISRETMDEVMDTYPCIARAMFITQLVDEATLRAWIVSMGRRNSLERVAHLLLELFIRANKIGLVGDDMMRLPLTQAVLADALGMTNVHINRTLQDLRRQDAVALQRGMLTIHAPAALVQIAGFDDTYLHRRLRERPSSASHR